MDTSSKTVGAILDLGEKYLVDCAVSEARLKCEMLLARLLGVPRLELHLRRDTLLRESQLQAMRRALKRLRECEPIQYVIGETGFMHHVFKTDQRALIPRPETEVLVSQVLQDSQLWQRECPRIVDVGTGSGCIILSLAAAHPDAHYLATDMSEKALALAKENAEKLQLQDHVLFYAGDLEDVVEPEMLDAIVANLPYIPSRDVDALDREVREYEPRMALDGGEEGLDVIADLIADATIVLKNQGRIFLEIGAEQGAAVQTLLQDSGFQNIEVLKDLQRRDRVVCATLASML